MGLTKPSQKSKKRLDSENNGNYGQRTWDNDWSVGWWLHAVSPIQSEASEKLSFPLVDLTDLWLMPCVETFDIQSNFTERSTTRQMKWGAFKPFEEYFKNCMRPTVPCQSCGMIDYTSIDSNMHQWNKYLLKFVGSVNLMEFHIWCSGTWIEYEKNRYFFTRCLSQISSFIKDYMKVFGSVICSNWRNNAC